MTQGEAQPSTKRFLIPPVSLEFQITQERRDRCQIHSRAYSGNHCFVHRQVEAFYDSFSEIPVMIGSSMLSWTLWLVQFERERREVHQGQPPTTLARFPDWPSPDPIAGRHTEVGF